MSLFHSIWTLISLLLFIGICVWAYSGARHERFRDAAQLPFRDDEPQNPRRGQDSDHV